LLVAVVPAAGALRVVQVLGGRVAGRSHQPETAAAGHRLALADVDLAEVAVPRVAAVGVADDHAQPPRAGAAGRHDGARGDRSDDVGSAVAEVDTRVVAGGVVAGDAVVLGDVRVVHGDAARAAAGSAAGPQVVRHG